MWDLPGSGIEPRSPGLAGRFLSACATREAHLFCFLYHFDFSSMWMCDLLKTERQFKILSGLIFIFFFWLLTYPQTLFLSMWSYSPSSLAAPFFLETAFWSPSLCYSNLGWLALGSAAQLHLWVYLHRQSWEFPSPFSCVRALFPGSHVPFSLFTSSLWTYFQELPEKRLFCFMCLSVLKCSWS